MRDEQDDIDAEAGREGWAMWIVRALFGAIVGPAVLASRSLSPAITAIECFPFGFGPATSLPSRTSQM